MSKHRYGVILDAGSSGTRVHIYSWLKSEVARANASPEELHQLPVVTTKNKKWTMKVHPGISSFADKADLVGQDHLQDLLEFALDVVPDDEVANTPIFLFATAGMRLLEDLPRRTLLAEVCKYAKSTTGFRLGDCDEHIQVISGETEGLYGWIAANYLVGGFNNPQDHAHASDHHTYGFLDMGGASAQIAFAPNSTESAKHANDLQLLRMRTVDGTPTEYKVFVTTFLGYGANEARRRFVEDLEQSHDTSGTHQALPDPCLPTGLELTKEGTIIEPHSPEDQGVEPYLRGTGKFTECVAATYKLLDKEAACVDSPCLFHGVHVPAIDFNINHFIGVSNFWHGTHEIFEMGHKDHAYDFATYQQRVSEFCSNDWSAIEERIKKEEWGDHVDEEAAAEACFKASWIINMLHDGIGVPRVGLEATDTTAATNGTKEVISSAEEQGYLLPFQAVNKIDDTEVEWTMGKMLLYASSQIPPADPHTLDVGFGTNDPNNPSTLPVDFQRGGSEPDVFEATPGVPDAANDHTDPIHNAVENAANGATSDNTDYEGNGDGDFAGIGDSSSWRDKLLNTANMAGRTPGYILIAVILLVIAILLCGRERRANLARKILHPFRRSGAGSVRLDGDSGGAAGGSIRQRRGKRPFGLDFARRGDRDAQGKYERLLEEGDMPMPNPAEFELHKIHSSEDDDADNHSNSSRTSAMSSGSRKGNATPRRVGGFSGSASGSLDGTFASSSAGASNQERRGGLKESLD